MENKDQQAILHPTPVQLRAVSTVWLKKRSTELATEQNLPEHDIEGALQEAVEVFRRRLAWNFDEASDVLVYEPSGPDDPYILALPLVKEQHPKKPLTPPKNDYPNSAKPAAVLTLKGEFERLMKAREEPLGEGGLSLNAEGEYINLHVRSMFEGFCMYHRDLSCFRQPTYKPAYDRIMGRYVVGAVTKTGSVLFTRAPYRHQRLDLAVTEAKRLAEEKEGTFAVFRCVDVICQN